MRVKIILANLAPVLISGLALWLILLREVKTRDAESLQSRMKTAAMIFTRFERLRSYELVSDAASAASAGEIVRAFGSDEYISMEEGVEEPRERFRKFAFGISQYLKRRLYHRPDLVVLTDNVGVAVARNITPNACPAGHSLTSGMDVVNRALRGRPAYSVWSVDDSSFSGRNPGGRQCKMMNSGLMELVAAPVWVDREIAGTIVLGFEISNGTTKRQAELLQTDIALVRNDRIFSSSLKTEAERNELKQTLLQPSVSKKVDAATALGKRSDFFSIEIGGERVVAVVMPISNMNAEPKVAALLLGSSGSGSLLRCLSIGLLIFLTMITAAIVMVGILVGNHFLKPVMEIEDGILRVINGARDFRFDIKSNEFGGLGYRINQMLDGLTPDQEASSEQNSPESEDPSQRDFEKEDAPVE